MFRFPNKPIRIYSIDSFIANLNPEDWLVQPKWDGKRCLPYCDRNGKVTLYGRQSQIFPLGVWSWLAELPLPKPWLLDAELLRDGRMFYWDFAIMEGKERHQERYNERLLELQRVPDLWQSFRIVDTVGLEHYRSILAPGKSNGLEGCVLKQKSAVDLWSVTKTSEVPSQYKYRF